MYYIVYFSIKQTTMKTQEQLNEVRKLWILKAPFKCFWRAPKHRRVDFPSDTLMVQSLFSIEYFHYCNN